jgi:LPXTG-motif cell wall-anchored protein
MEVTTTSLLIGIVYLLVFGTAWYFIYKTKKK